MEDVKDRIDVIVLGINIGTASGWDEVETAHIVFYNFKSTIWGLRDGPTINFDFQKGRISYFADEDGAELEFHDMIKIFKNF